MSLNKRNICILANGFPPWRIGGIQTWAEALAVRINNYGSNQVSVMLKLGGIDKNLTSPHSSIRFAFMRGHSWKKYHYLYTYYYLRKYLRKHSNVTIIAAVWRLARSAVVLKSHYNASLITATHGKEVSQLIHRNVKERRQFETVVHGSDAVIAVSNYTQKQIYDICQEKPENVHCIPNGTDPEIYTPLECREIARLKTQHQIEPETKVLLTVARLTPRKGHDIVIRALSQAIKVYPNIVYIIAGPEHSSWKNHLEVMVSDLGLEGHVKFLGEVSERQKLNLYQLSDIYLMVSKSPIYTGDSEGFGISFLEANACGVPAIGSSAGGIPDAVEDSVSGLLIEPENVDQTTDAIIKLLSDDGYRTKLGIQGRKRVEDQFTWDHVVAKIWALVDR